MCYYLNVYFQGQSVNLNQRVVPKSQQEITATRCVITQNSAVLVHYSCQILLKLEFFLQIFEKYSNIKFHENPSSGSRVVPCGRTDGQTDRTMLIVASSNFANTPKNGTLSNLSIESVGDPQHRSHNGNPRSRTCPTACNTRCSQCGQQLRDEPPEITTS